MSKFFDKIQSAVARPDAEMPSSDFNLEGVLSSVAETLKEDFVPKHVLLTDVPQDDQLKELGETLDVAGASRNGNHSEAGEMASLEECQELSLPKELQHDSAIEESAILATESYRVLSTRLSRLQAAQSWRSIVITSASPGEGKTYTVLNLGVSLAGLRDSKVLLIDADLRTQGLTRMVAAAQNPGLAEVLKGQINPSQAIVRTDCNQMFIMPAGKVFGPRPELFAGAKWSDLIAWATNNFQMVLVDAPPVLPLADFEMMSAQIHRILVVVRAQQTKRGLLEALAGQIDRKKLIGAVYNGSAAAKNYTNYLHYGKATSAAAKRR